MALPTCTTSMPLLHMRALRVWHNLSAAFMPHEHFILDFTSLNGPLTIPCFAHDYISEQLTAVTMRGATVCTRTAHLSMTSRTGTACDPA